MNTNSAFTASYNENAFWYQQFKLRQIRILRGGQPIVDFDAADKCRLYVETMKAMNFQDDIPSIPIDNFKDHYVLVFDLTSMQDATGNCHYPELVGEPLMLGPNFTFPLNTLLNSLYWENKCLQLQLTSFVLLEKTSKWIVFLCSKKSTVSHYSSIGTVAFFPRTMFQLLTMTLLPLYIRNPAICRVSIG